jgi:hypothetical protein
MRHQSTLSDLVHLSHWPRGGGLEIQVWIAGVWHRLRVRVTPLDYAISEPVVGSVGRLGILELAQPVQVSLNLLSCGLVEQR